MIRQRIAVRRMPVTELVIRLLVTVLGLATIFYAVMVVLAALKLDPHTLNQISAYRTIEQRLSSITAAQITGSDRIIIAAAGVLSVLVAAPLAVRALPRAYRERTRLPLVDGAPPTRGTTELSPRTVEQVAVRAASAQPEVTRARGRYGAGAVHVALQTSTGDEPLALLQAVQGRVREALHRSGLPELPVDVTLTAIEQGDTP